MSMSISTPPGGQAVDLDDPPRVTRRPGPALLRPAAGISVTCCARGPSYHNPEWPQDPAQASLESRIHQELLPAGVPVVGFFANGEIGQLGDDDGDDDDDNDDGDVSEPPVTEAAPPGIDEGSATVPREGLLLLPHDLRNAVELGYSTCLGFIGDVV